MKTIRSLSLTPVLLFGAATPALASTIVTSPANGAQVPSPFTLFMSADTCSAQPVTAVGYSLDNSTDTPTFAGPKMDGPVSAPAGPHTLHVKVWGDQGAVCVTDVGFTVGSGAGLAANADLGPTASADLTFNEVVPSNAVRVSAIQALGNWTQIHDGGTPGSSSGWTGTQGWPSLTGWAREFYNTFSYYGGERYSVQFADDNASTNFFYDVWVYVAGSTAGFSNLEFDLNQTMPNGQTVVMGFQCDSWNNTWDFAYNTGSPTAFNDTWAHSKDYCNARNWTPNTWHHVQIWYGHNYSGWVTYHAVWLDGLEEDINVTAFSGYALGWGPAVVTNFQIDGSSSGYTTAQVYLDDMIVYRW
jgi:hypothetical protein